MRTGGTFNSAAPMASESTMSQHSPWHSPVPYLFGGLAAMLGLIAFALLILACSYWKLSGYLENDEGAARDPENADEKVTDGIKLPVVYEEKIVVIMAGDKKPSFIATPISSKPSSFGDNNNKINNDENDKSEKDEERGTQEQQHQQQQETEQNRETTQSQNQETQSQN